MSIIKCNRAADYIKGVYPFPLNKRRLAIDKLTKIAQNILLQDSEFEILCGLIEAFELGMTTKMDKAQLLEFLKENLKVDVTVDEDVELRVKDDIVRTRLVRVTLTLGSDIISVSETELPLRF